MFAAPLPTCRTALLPTHVERTPELAADGLRWLREGGCVDLTAGKPVTLTFPELGVALVPRPWSSTVHAGPDCSPGA